MDAAITRSDNDAARLLWDRLDDGAAEVEAVLRRAGDDQHDTRARSRPARLQLLRPHRVVAAGRAQRSMRRSREVSCCRRRDTERVLDAMGRIVPEQRWGLGRLPGIRFKGGWGPSERPEGGYEVIQVGIAGPTVIAIAARAEDFEAAKRLASKHVPQHPNTP